MNAFTKIPEKYRGWAYLFLAVVAVVGAVVLAYIDISRGGEVDNWLTIVLAVLGLSNSMAASNTARR